MDRPNGVASVYVPRAWCTAWARSVGRTRLLPISGYLRGLSASRVALVLLICTLFTIRQLSLCVFQLGCGLPYGQTVAGFGIFLGRQFFASLPMLIAVTVVDNVTSRRGTRARILAFSTAVVSGAIVYGLVFLYTQPPNVLAAAEGRHGLFILAYSSRAVLYGGLATAMLYLFVREREDARALHATRLEKVALDRQTIEAQIQVLQAQIEPHFLFNTLANIKLLYEVESSRAKPLIHDLAAYLRTALPQMRERGCTLGRELELVQAYLRVLRVRMGERLRVVTDVAADLENAAMPPMMLLTLVENALKHGIGSLPKGGTIILRAERIAERLRLSVIDDGVGFPKGFGAGVGLANTRARLRALYGKRGRLTLAANPSGGVIAEIELPLQMPTAGAAVT
jgi:sensor histidine kinase YesM